MTPERWRQIEDVCQSALGLEGEERARFLEGACGGDQELRREVDSLLADGCSADALLGTPPWEAAAREFEATGSSGALLQPGSLLGPFRIEALIGSGGMGEVYRARDTRLGRTVAIKVLLSETRGDPERRRRLVVEARAASALNHPHICTLLDFRADGGVDYLVMEYLAGPTLSARIEQAPSGAEGGPAVPLPEALDIAAQIADALAAAHSLGILHRDLKPGNVMLTRGGVKLLDFGLAKFKPAFAGAALAGAGGAAPRTSPGAMLGTVNYMAPEQLNGGEPDARSDLFAFGAVLYELVTGRRAFDGSTAASVIAQILERDPRLPSEMQPLVPPSLDRLVKGCLAKDPDRRWDSARLAAEELRRIAGSLGAEVNLRQPPVGPSQGAPTRPVRRRLLRAGAPGVALVALAAAFWWLWMPRPAPAPLQRLPLDFGVTFDVAPRMYGVALSPDGARLAFNGADPRGRTGLFTRPLDEGNPKLLSERPLEDLVFSPDGQWLAGVAGGRLVKVRVADGAVVDLGPGFMGRGVTWIDNQVLVAARGPSHPLVLIDPGGAATPLTELDRANGESTHRWPNATPDGTVVVFTSSTTNADYDNATIEAVRLDTRQRKVLHRGGFGGRYLPSGHVVFVHRDTLFAMPVNAPRMSATGPPVPVVENILADATTGRLLFSASRTGAALVPTGYRPPAIEQPTWVSSSGERVPLPIPPGDYLEPRLSPDGRRLLLSLRSGLQRQTVVHDLERDTPVRLLSGTRDLTPLWAPDGAHVVYGAEGDGGIHNLFWRRADGKGEVRQLTHSRNVQYTSSFSPDGTLLAFGELDPETLSDIWILPLDLSNPDLPIAGEPRPFLQTPDSTGAPAFSPDGRWIAFQQSPTGEAPHEIIVARADNPAERWVAVTPGLLPRWSLDGRRLFFQQSRLLMYVDFTLKDGAPRFGRPRTWGGETPVRNKADAMRDWDIGPDPSRAIVLFPAPPQPTDRPRAAVTLFLNFFDEVQRKVAGGR